MSKKKILSLFLLFFPFWVWAQQNNKVKYTLDFRFNDGVYLNFDAVKANKPIPLMKIQAEQNENTFDFYEKLFENDFIYIYDDFGKLEEIPISEIWGYAQNGKLFINLHDNFNRIPYFGSISHFLADVTTYQTMPTTVNSRYYTAGSSYYPTTKTTETRQFIMDFSDGKVYEYDYKNLLVVLMKDQELYDEYNELSRRKKKKLKFLFIRKYNDRNPVYFPIN